MVLALGEGGKEAFRKGRWPGRGEKEYSVRVATKKAHLLSRPSASILD